MEKQTQIMVVHQNILGTVMLTNDRLSNGNVRLHLAKPEIYRARNEQPRYCLKVFKSQNPTDCAKMVCAPFSFEWKTSGIPTNNIYLFELTANKVLFKIFLNISICKTVWI